MNAREGGYVRKVRWIRVVEVRIRTWARSARVGYSKDLKLTENPWQDLKIALTVSIQSDTGWTILPRVGKTTRIKMCKADRDKSQKSYSYNYRQRWFFQVLFCLINDCVTIIKIFCTFKVYIANVIWHIMLDILSVPVKPISILGCNKIYKMLWMWCIYVIIRLCVLHIIGCKGKELCAL